MIKAMGLVLLFATLISGQSMASGKTSTGKLDSGEKISCISTNDANTKLSCEVTGQSPTCYYRRNGSNYFDGKRGCTFNDEQACYIDKDVVCQDPNTGREWVDRTEQIFLGCFDSAVECRFAR